MDPSLPTLPAISGDPNIMLDVYTHSSVRHAGGPSDPEYGNPERLAELGKRMLDLAVTYHFFRLKPHLAAGEIAVRKDDTLSDDAIVRWIEGYELKNKIRAYPHTILDDPNELRIFFYTFIGALYIRNGIHEVQDWISHLIDPDHEPDPMPSPPQQQQQTQGLPTQPSQPPPPLPLFNPSIPPPMTQSIPPPMAQTATPGSNPFITLQLIHQTAAQKGYAVTYGAQSEGPPHAPTWTVQCLFNGHLTGTGQGRSQKLAREEAARQAWNSSGWGPQA